MIKRLAKNGYTKSIRGERGQKMNREIKFRAWDKNQKKIYTVVGLDFAEMNVIYGEYTDWEIHSLKNVILMQFTGLKDKNGVDVYEGDIIESTILGVKFKGEVFWETAGWRVKGDDLDITLGNDKAKTRKVIGTIYENPELLTQEQEVRE